MLVRQGQRSLVPLLITVCIIAPFAACSAAEADPEITGLVIPSGPPRPTAARTSTAVSPTGTPSERFTASVSATTPDDVRHTYRPGCPVGPRDLRTITMTFRTYAGQVRTGVLIVAATQSATVVDVFRQAFDAGFRINRMDNPNVWNGDDEQMMAADNTSAFNCRAVAGNSSELSPHSYGTAIGVNPRRNPHRAAGGIWHPSNGARWVDRSLDEAAMIRSSSAITRAFLRAGGTWGGNRAEPKYEYFALD